MAWSGSALASCGFLEPGAARLFFFFFFASRCVSHTRFGNSRVECSEVVSYTNYGLPAADFFCCFLNSAFYITTHDPCFGYTEGPTGTKTLRDILEDVMGDLYRPLWWFEHV